MKLRALLFILLSLFALSGAHAQIYKWVDEKGVTHYGQKAPEGAKSSEVKLSTPDEATLAAAQARLAKIREALLNRDSQNTKANNPAGPSASPNAARCNTLRQQLTALEGRLADVPPALAQEARTRVAKELEAACSSAAANNQSKEAECTAALQGLLAMENPQSRASNNEREALRNRARASCQ
jgi:phage-related tail fiber protein